MISVSYTHLKLANCLLADKIVQVFSRMNYSCESLFSEYFKGEGFQLYCLLKGPDYKETGYEENRKQKQQSINHYTLNCDLQIFKKLIDVCNGISELDNHSYWEVGEGLGLSLIHIFRTCWWSRINHSSRTQILN